MLLQLRASTQGCHAPRIRSLSSFLRSPPAVLAPSSVLSSSQLEPLLARSLERGFLLSKLSFCLPLSAKAWFIRMLRLGEGAHT
jgi:hypothetical protein